jgi:hypothetical protein
LVERQNQGQANTTVGTKLWVEIVVEATPSPLGLQWFTTKLLGYLTEPQSKTEDSAQQTDRNQSD